jgi:hypothetical protein
MPNPKPKNKRPDTPLAQTPVPDYRNIKTGKRTLTGFKEIVPTAKDSADYRAGFNDVVNKVRSTTMSKPSNYIRGQREAKLRGF